MDRAARRPSRCCQRAVAVVSSRAKSPRPVSCRWVAVAASSAPLESLLGFSNVELMSNISGGSFTSRYGPMDMFHRSLGALRGAAHLTMCAKDYGSRDSVYAYITREDLVRIPVAIFFFFFCPLDHLRRGKPNSGVWRRMSTLVPYERRARPAKYHDVGARSPRRHEVHAARCCRAMGGASTA